MARILFGLWLSLGVVLSVRADVLPPVVRELQQEVSRTALQLSQAQQNLAQLQRRYAALDAELRAWVRWQWRSQLVPAGVWQWRSVLLDAPPADMLLAVALRQQSAALLKQRAQVEKLTAVYGTVQARLAAAQLVQENFKAARGRLHAQEELLLKAERLNVAALAADLAAATGGEAAAIQPDAQRPMAGPVWPVRGRLVQRFGAGRGATAAGVIVQGAVGLPVVVPRAGKVLYAGPFRQFGGLVIVATAPGEDVVLGGLGGLSVNVGDAVTAGQQVGILGPGGRLYWELQRRGKSVDPL